MRESHGSVSAASKAAERTAGAGDFFRRTAGRAFSHQITGPTLALLVAVVIFTATTDTFFTATNASLMLQQSVVIGTLAIGQTLVILTAGIDLANGAIMVLGTVVVAQVALNGNVVVALLLGIVVCAVAGALNGWISSYLRLPPFIVTLGTFTALTAVARLMTDSQSIAIERGVLTALGQGFRLGNFTITWGMLIWASLTAVMAYALSSTSWGRRVYAVGDAPAAAKLNGVNVARVLFSAYVVAGVIYAIAAWQSLGRTPIADPSAFQTANLDSITAVVIGGTSLFGGRGGVVGTLVGTAIVVVLQNGLTQAGIDSLYQQVATGVLVIVAVLVDQLGRRRGAS